MTKQEILEWLERLAQFRTESITNETERERMAANEEFNTGFGWLIRDLKTDLESEAN
jgi:hypothetical protein